ncbi:sensor histidine kinase [Agromyces protaetiae]|nr:histidine kinase [Agromyces protaetiae]
MSEASEALSPVVDGVEWVRPRPTRAQIRNDAVLAAAILVGSLVSAVLFRTAGVALELPAWSVPVWAVAIALPLAFRRIAPEIVALVVAAVFMIGGQIGVGDTLFANIALFMAVYSVGAWGRSRLRVLVVRTIIVVAMFGWLFWWLIISSNAPDYLPDLSRSGGPFSPYVAFALIQILTNLLYFGGAWYFGDTAYRSARERTALEQRTRELADERERAREQAVALERLRIARELHDVVAHHVSVIGVQAGAARRVLDRDPALAAESLSAIEQSAREAVAELHGLLGTLRSGDSDASPATGPIDAAPHGVDELPSLANEASANGLPTEFSVVGDPVPTSGLIGVTAYRLVQEALTNVRKHGGAGATADVRVRWSDDILELEVCDTGVGAIATAGRAGGAGLGLVGMRERVAAAGGELEAGPRRRGGYLVRASLPLRRSEVGA